MNQKIVDYLQQNKEQYSRESLIIELKKIGFPEEEIEEGEKIVYSEKEIHENSNESATEDEFVSFEHQTKYNKIIRVIFYSIFAGVGVFAVVSIPVIFCGFGCQNLTISEVIPALFIVFLPCVISFFFLWSSGIFQKNSKGDNTFKNQRFRQVKKISFWQRIGLYITNIALIIVIEVLGTLGLGFFLAAFSDSSIDNIESKISNISFVANIIFLAGSMVVFFAGRTTIKRCGYFNEKIFFKEILYALFGVFFPALFIFLFLF